MKLQVSLKHHLIALGIVFSCATVLAFAYATWYYEYHENYQARVMEHYEGAKKEFDAARAEGDAELCSRCENGPPAPSLRSNTWISHLPQGLFYWWPWIILTPCILELCRFFRFRAGAWKLAFCVHFAAGLACGAGKTLIEQLLQREFMRDVDVVFGVGNISIACTTYWTYVAAYCGLAYYRQYREREMRTIQLEAQLAQAQLQVLKMQLHPHFLFNTLHAVSTLMHSNIDAAERMIIRLSDLLRLSLNSLDKQEVTLRSEIDFLDLYLDIERIRFGDRLVVEMDISRETLGAAVPNLILQPIVENAVNHGIGKIASTGRIVVRAVRMNGELCIEVADNGPGPPHGDVAALSRVGLANTMDRISQLYGSDGRVEFDTLERGGLVVRLTIPFHRAPVEETKEPRNGRQEDQSRHR